MDLPFAVIFSAIDRLSSTLSNIGSRFSNLGGSAQEAARVGSTMEYAIQERGGTITAKNVRNRTIPLSPIHDGRAVARGTARDVIASRVSMVTSRRSSVRR